MSKKVSFLAESLAYRMIQIAEEFSAMHGTKLSMSQMLEILALPLPTRELIKEELEKENPDIDSIQKTILTQKELLAEEKSSTNDIQKSTLEEKNNNDY